MQLKTYIEQATQYLPTLSIQEKIEVGRAELFDFPYPIFDKSYKRILETNIIRKFYFREIGFETEQMFKFHLESFMQLNMPYFNRLFETELLDYDPLINSEMKLTHTRKKDKGQKDITDSTRDREGLTLNTGSGEGSANSNAYSKNLGTNQTKELNENDDFERNVRTDTPDKRLQIATGSKGTGVIEYASDIQEDVKKDVENKARRVETSDTNNQSGSQADKSSYQGKVDDKSNIKSNEKLDSEIKELEDFVQNRVGKIGTDTYSEMIEKYRNSFIRVENMIHREMSDLFMMIY